SMAWPVRATSQAQITSRRSGAASTSTAHQLTGTSSGAERFLDLGPEAAATARRLALDGGKLAEERLLLGGEALGSPEMDPHDEISGAALPQPRKSLAAQRNGRAGLDARRHFDRFIAVRRRNGERCAERRLGKRHGQIVYQVVPVALETVVL